MRWEERRAGLENPWVCTKTRLISLGHLYLSLLIILLIQQVSVCRDRMGERGLFASFSCVLTGLSFSSPFSTLTGTERSGGRGASLDVAYSSKTYKDESTSTQEKKIRKYKGKQEE
jgi:hypothetical protein